MAGTYPIYVKEIIRETADAVTIVFDIPVHLNQEFDYEPGQYLTLECIIDGKKYRRPYSLSSSPLTDSQPAVTVKKVEGGLVSSYLNDQIKTGDFIHVLPPDGHFTPQLDPNHFKQYVLIGAGSGITPLFSIAKSILKFEPYSNILLLLGNRTESSIIFYKSLLEMEKNYNGRFNTVHFLTRPDDNWKGHSGRINAMNCGELLTQRLGNELTNAEYFLCGPGEMIQSVIELLKTKNVDEGRLHKEYFTIAPKTGAEAATIVGSGEIKAGAKKVTVIFENETHELIIDDNRTILDACIDADIDAPYACKMAACSTCRAKLVSGEVKMDDREILTDSEIKKGYILTCQSHPLNDVVVSYDEG